MAPLKPVMGLAVSPENLAESVFSLCNLSLFNTGSLSRYCRY
jgi:hypothetical protein